MTWQDETAELIADVRDAFKRTITINTRELLSETYSPATGARTNNAGQQFQVSAWSSAIRPVDDKLSERTFYIAVADFDIDDRGKPGPGWTITDSDADIRPTSTPWVVSEPATIEADGACWALVCRRAH